MSDVDVIKALRNTQKGKLKYDRYFEEEGRTKGIVDEISSRLTRLSVSPKILALVSTYEHDNLCSKGNFDAENQTKRHSFSSTKKTKILDNVVDESDSSEKELPLLEYEAERFQSVMDLYNIKRDEYETFTNELLQQIEQQYLILKEKQQLDALRKAAEFQRLERQQLEDFLEKQNCFLKNEEPTTRIKEIEMKRLLAEEELLKKKEKADENLKSKLEEYKKKILEMKLKIEAIFKLYGEKYLTTTCIEWMSHITEILSVFDNMVALSNSIMPETILKAQAILRDLEVLYQSITANVEKEYQARHKVLNELSLNQAKSLSSPKLPEQQPYNTHMPSSVLKADDQGKESEARTTNLDDLNSKQVKNVSTLKFNLPEQQSSNTHVPAPVSKAVDQVISNQLNSSFEKKELKQDEALNSNRTANVDDMEECDTFHEEKEQLALYIDPEASREYCAVLQNLKKLESSLEEFKSNPKYKKYRLELHKAVAINTISDASGAQLRAKISLLVNLLSGQPMECGGKYTSCKQHDSAINYCKNLLAEKIVTQGEEQVRSKISAAFPFAVVAVALCSKFPDLWQLILGHFYVRCPYLVPYYPPREENQSDKEFYISLCYKYIDGKLEERTNFLKRMHGFATLYAAIIQTDPPSGFSVKHSHGIEHGWVLMARILNMDPRPDITATLILAILEVTGHALAKNYDRQFKKILHVLCKDYFHKMKQMAASGGPVGRLKDFLHAAVAKGRISPPEGILSSHFWRT